MATVSTLPVTPKQSTLPSDARQERFGLSFWVGRVQEELHRVCARAGAGTDADAVHDLRVAIRRCRSLASVMLEVDPHPTWLEMRKLPRKLFRELGELRDAQVLEDWVKRLTAEGDPLRGKLLAVLEEHEQELRASALRRADKFDAKKWKSLGRILCRRARLIPYGSPAALCLALERYDIAHNLHARALRSDRPKPWHALRIGLKHLRYTAENLLPGQYAAWESGLKSAQDLLGDVHDLDVLAALVKEQMGDVSAESVEALRQAIGGERRERIEEYRQRTIGHSGLWQQWRAGLPHGPQMEEAVAARLHATARALDAHPRRTVQTARLAGKLFDAFASAHASPLFGDSGARRILLAAARLHGIGDALGRKTMEKAASNLLRGLPSPPGWKTNEWESVAWVVRYHRGPEPKARHRRFAALPEEQRNLVRGAVGVLRLARALRRCGADSPRGLRVSQMPHAISLRIAGLTDSANNAARLAAGKHLLETHLGRPLLIATAEKLVALPSPHLATNEIPRLNLAAGS